jgi:alkanesulfonate monooxygenase SsuD/methylene tetrahydromethanopterin reductase-like flavin-dependent oxidoreductase (luciferase family)
MKLGLFMMPLHDPNRDYTKILQDDREAILLAEKLGYEEAWVGEHYSAATEPITDPLQFMATLIPVTKSIKFGTSVLNLPQHHPAQVAGNCAMFDHLCEGRFVMGIGPGGLGSDFELFKVTDKDRSEMMVESIEIIHKIWASDPPYHIRGKYWDITIDSSYQPRLGIGPMRKPYQKPYPPVAVSAMSPSRRRHASPARGAGGLFLRISCPSAMPRLIGSNTAPVPTRRGGDPNAPNGA